MAWKGSGGYGGQKGNVGGGGSGGISKGGATNDGNRGGTSGGKKKSPNGALVGPGTIVGNLPAGATPPGQLPPGANPLKNTVNDTISYEGTAENLAKAVARTAPGVGAVATVADALGVDVGLGYDNPTGTVGGADYDKSETSKDPNVKPAPKRKTTKPKNPLGAVGTILGTAGGTLTAGGL